MYTFHQIGGDCSLCGTKGVNAQTCPLHPKNLEKGKGIGKHHKAREKLQIIREARGVVAKPPRVIGRPVGAKPAGAVAKPPRVIGRPVGAKPAGAVAKPPRVIGRPVGAKPAGAVAKPEHPKPTILVLQSRYDRNRAFDRDGDIGLFTIFRQLVNYNLVHEHISTMGDIERIFGGLNNIAHLVIMAHGTVDRLLISDTFHLTMHTPEFYRLGELLQHYLLPNASVLLHSCLVGQGGPTQENFAQNLANIVPNHTIYGSDKAIQRGDLLVYLAKPVDNMAIEMGYQIDPVKGYELYSFNHMEMEFSGGGYRTANNWLVIRL